MTQHTADKAPRRTQLERSASMRDTLIQATLDCLRDVGYAKTTVSEICQRAAVSRGALLHHFPNKNQLIVASYLVKQEESIADLLHGDDGARRSVRDEVLTLRQQMEATFPVSYEFFWALRTDDDLRAELHAQLSTRQESLGLRYQESAVSALDHAPDPLLSRYVIGCFLRGLLLEVLVSERETVEQICEHFIRMLSAFVAAAQRTA